MKQNKMPSKLRAFNKKERETGIEPVPDATRTARASPAVVLWREVGS